MPELRVVQSEEQVDVETATFADFWLMYPKRVSKREAENAWNRLSNADRVAALVGLMAWRPIWLARQDLTYVPYASTWIHQCRWEDELPATWGASHLSHLPAAIPTSEPKAAIPEKVRDYLAKLRAK